MMAGKSQAAIIHAFALCRSKLNQRIMYCVGTNEGRNAALANCKVFLEGQERIKYATGHIVFPNGSAIIVYKADSVTGYEANEVLFDSDTDSLDRALIEHLKTRARLK